MKSSQQTWTQLALALLTLLSLAVTAGAQYYTGYGTGPLPLAPYALREMTPEELDDLRPAANAGRLAELLYGPPQRRQDIGPVPMAESIYKYTRPNFPTRFAGNNVIGLLRRRR